MFNKIQKVLREHNKIEHNLSQSYDNASKMKHSKKGLQALFKKKNINRYADYKPCASHLFNLVGKKIVSTVTEVVDYFGILQELYIFFSVSPLR